VVILANKLLKERLADHGYYEVPHISGLYTHKTRPIWFTLRVDDFSIKYSGKEHADHLLQVLRGHCMVEVDWNGAQYCRITLNWNYMDRYVGIFMPNYVQKQLVRYRQRESHQKQLCPFQPAPINYGWNSDELKNELESRAVGKEDETYIRQVVGSFLYYARAVNLTMLTTLSDIASEQSKPTEKTMKRVKKLLDYMYTNPNTVIRFHASDTILNLHSDASYLSAACRISQEGCYVFLGSMPKNWQTHLL